MSWSFGSRSSWRPKFPSLRMLWLLDLQSAVPEKQLSTWSNRIGQFWAASAVTVALCPQARYLNSLGLSASTSMGVTTAPASLGYAEDSVRKKPNFLWSQPIHNMLDSILDYSFVALIATKSSWGEIWGKNRIGQQLALDGRIFPFSN